MNAIRLAALAMLLLAAVVGALTLGPSDEPLSAESADRAHLPRYQLTGLQVQRTDAQGQIAVQIAAKQANYYDDSSANIFDVRVQAPADQGQPWQFSAPQAYVPAGKKQVQLFAPVKGSGSWPDGEPLTMAAQKVLVDPVARRYSSQQPVAIDSPNRSAHASNFVANFAGTQLTLQNVEMRYALGN